MRSTRKDFKPWLEDGLHLNLTSPSRDVLQREEEQEWLSSRPMPKPLKRRARRRVKSGAPETLTYTTAGLVVVFWLLWGDFAWSMRDRAIPPTVQLLLNKFGASDMIAGLLFGSLPPAIGLILGPIISYKIDRHRGRWGRRIPSSSSPHRSSC